MPQVVVKTSLGSGTERQQRRVEPLHRPARAHLIRWVCSDVDTKRSKHDTAQGMLGSDLATATGSAQQCDVRLPPTSFVLYALPPGSSLSSTRSPGALQMPLPPPCVRSNIHPLQTADCVRVAPLQSKDLSFALSVCCARSGAAVATWRNKIPSSTSRASTDSTSP